MEKGPAGELLSDVPKVSQVSRHFFYPAFGSETLGIEKRSCVCNSMVSNRCRRGKLIGTATKLDIQRFCSSNCLNA